MTAPDASTKWRLEVTSNLPTPAPGWGFLAWPGMYSDLDHEDDLPDVVMVNAATIDWSFTDDQLPSQLNPSSLTFTLWARTALDLPSTLQRGSQCEWGITLYPGSGTPVDFYGVNAARITEATLDLFPGQRWAARLTCKAVDLLSDLSSLTPFLAAGELTRRRARERLVQICASMGLGVGVAPTALQGGTYPPLANLTAPRLNLEWSGNARDQLSKWCASAWDVLVTPIICPWYDEANGAAYPTGYVWAGPAVWQDPALGQVQSLVKYMIAPGTKPAPNMLPLRLSRDDGAGHYTADLHLEPAPDIHQHTAAVSAAWVDIPGRLRSGREHAPNVFRFSGTVEGIDASVMPNELHERNATADAYTSDYATTGPRVRDVDTLLELGTYTYADQAQGNLWAAGYLTQLAGYYTPDTYAQTRVWALDAITLHTERMTEAQIRSVLPRLIPSYPLGTGVGEDGDGVLIRHVTLFDLPPEAYQQVDAPMPQGYVTSGRWTFEDGALTIDITMVPGAAPGTGQPVRVSDVLTANYDTTPVSRIDRNIRVLDLALVDE